jgi:hypothetical protein
MFFFAAARTARWESFEESILKIQLSVLNCSESFGIGFHNLVFTPKILSFASLDFILLSKSSIFQTDPVFKKKNITYLSNFNKTVSW